MISVKTKEFYFSCEVFTSRDALNAFANLAVRRSDLVRVLPASGAVIAAKSHSRFARQAIVSTTLLLSFGGPRRRRIPD